MNEVVQIDPLFKPDDVLHHQVKEMIRAVIVEMMLGYPIPAQKLEELLKLFAKLDAYSGHLEGLIMDGIEKTKSN